MKAFLLLGVVGVFGCTQIGAVRARPAGDGAQSMSGAKAEVYKTAGDAKLSLFIFEDAKASNSKLRPAIVFFFGGGWNTGSPGQFEKQARYLASRGMVAITADYRVRTRDKAKVIDCVADARSAIRWVRANAERLGVDPNRIAAAGGSAGGHLAACTAFVSEFDDPSEDVRVSASPNALILFNPALVLASLPDYKLEGTGAQLKPDFLGTEASRISPAHHIKSGGPPTMIFHGRADSTVPYQTAEIFTDRMKAAGNDCNLKGYSDQGHGFFNKDPWMTRTLIGTDEFLASLGWLKGAPTLKETS